MNKVRVSMLLLLLLLLVACADEEVSYFNDIMQEYGLITEDIREVRTAVANMTTATDWNMVADNLHDNLSEIEFRSYNVLVYQGDVPKGSEKDFEYYQTAMNYYQRVSVNLGPALLNHDMGLLQQCVDDLIMAEQYIQLIINKE
jgi:hypothetical protein